MKVTLLVYNLWAEYCYVSLSYSMKCNIIQDQIFIPSNRVHDPVKSCRIKSWCREIEIWERKQDVVECCFLHGLKQICVQPWVQGDSHGVMHGVSPAFLHCWICSFLFLLHSIHLWIQCCSSASLIRDACRRQILTWHRVTSASNPLLQPIILWGPSHNINQYGLMGGRGLMIEGRKVFHPSL